MSGQLRKEDIVNQQEIQDAFASMAKSVQPFIDNIKEAGEVAVALNEALKSGGGFKQIVKDSNKAAENTKNYIKNTKEFNSIVKLGLQQQKEYNKELSLQAQAAKKVADEEKKKNAEMQRSKTSLETQRSKAYTQELKKQEAATKLLIKAKNTAAGSVERLRAVNAMYANRMKELNVLIPAQRAQYERLSKAVQANNARIQKMSGGTKELKGTFSNLIRSIGSYAAAIFGLNRLIRFFTNDLLRLVTKLDSLDFSMRTVIKTQDEYAQTQLFLSKTALNYGQDILTLTERYVKFRAATQQSNMSIADTQKIFDSTAKAAAVLGLRTDEVNGVFLALEQMVSKGKVTTEELRRQLGERLPGAFGIMADAIGVSIRELDRMLKAGEVLSSEALPKFAEALEKAYGIESVNKVDTLAAAQGRLKTSWVEFVKALQANNVYITILDNLNDKFTNFAILLSNGSRDLHLFSQLTGRAGNYVRMFSNALDNVSFDELNEGSKEFWVNWLDRAGFSTKQALRIWEQYYEQRRLMEKEESAAITPFDAETYRKQLDAAKSEFENFSKIQSDSFKKVFLRNAAFMESESDNYEEYIKNQIVLKEQETESSLKELKKQEALTEITRYNLKKAEESGNAESIRLAMAKFQQQNKLTELALSNYQNYINARMLLESELYGDGDKGTKDDSFKLMQERHKREIEETKKQQETIIQQSDLTEETLMRMKFDNSKELLIQRQSQLAEELESVKGNALEELKIKTELAKVEADLAKDLTDFIIDEKKRQLKAEEDAAKDREDKLKEQSAKAYNILYDSLTAEQTARIRAASEDIERNKSKAKKIREIETQLTLDLIDIETKRISEVLAGNEVIGNERERLNERLLDLDQARAEKENEIIKQSYETQKEGFENVVSAASEIAGRSFDIISGIYDAQMAKIDQLYEYEMAAAGDSVERRILAERKYEKEKNKILKKQAIAEKAQAAFSIIINTAQAVMATLGQTGFFGTPLAAIIAALGAAQLATVMSQPIPEFAKGTTDAPETFIAGEKGQEVILKNDGTAVLTPDNPTLFSDRSYIGSTILPHDETQKMLANYAITQSHDVIDMSGTNKYLKKIADNTSQKREFFERNGNVYMRRKYITSKIV